MTITTEIDKEVLKRRQKRNEELIKRLTLDEAVAAGVELKGVDALNVNSPDVRTLYTEEEIAAARPKRYLLKKGRPGFMYVRHFDRWYQISEYRKFLTLNKLLGNQKKALLLAGDSSKNKPKKIKLTSKQKRMLTFRPADPNEKRNEADFYPTPGESAQVIFDFLNLPRDTVIYDPCCGAGHVAKTGQMNGYKVIASDLYDYGFGEPGLNFLYSKFTEYDWIITNPPFSLAAEFIERAYANRKPFAFFLKATFWNAIGRRELFIRTKPTHVLPLTWRPNVKFSPRNKSTMECMWVVWGPDSFDPDKPHFTDFWPIKKPTNYPVYDINANLLEPFNMDIQ